MYPVIDRAVNNYIGALNLFASVGVDNKSTMAYYAREVCQSIIEYHMDHFNDKRSNYVTIAVKEALRLAQAQQTIFSYTMEYDQLVDLYKFNATIELNTVKKSNFELTCMRKGWDEASWRHYLESLHTKYNQPLRPTKGLAEYMRDR